MKFQTSYFAILALLMASFLHADDWARFRGPNGSGIAAGDKPTPTEWSPETVKWKSKINGQGVSSPIVVGDKIFVTSYSGYGTDRGNPGNMDDLKRHITCFDKNSGKELWSKTIDPVLPEEPYRGMGIPAHGYASHTPVSDGKHVFAFFGRTGVVAFDMDGKQLWQTSVGKGASPKAWGSASSPIEYENLVIVPATAEASSLIALEKTTGKEVWTYKYKGFYDSWSTPLLSKVNDERTDLVFGLAYELCGVNPKTGKLQWYAAVIDSSSFSSSPVEKDGIIYAVEGRRGGGSSVALKAGGKEDAAKNAVWTKSETGSFCSPLVVKGLVYHFANNSIKCLNAKTGDVVYQSRIPGASANSGGQERGGRGNSGRPQRGGFGRGRGGGGGSQYASPVAAGNKLYYLRTNGTTLVVEVGDKFKKLADNKVTTDSENFSATPAISDGMIFLRSDKHLYCVTNKPKAEKPAVDKK